MEKPLTGRADRPDWAPLGIDLDTPNVARVYDYYLGGAHNFAADRQMAEQAIRGWPELPQIMRANRAFLRRAVLYCVRQGIRQFLDLGSGIPTAGNVHQIAQAADPSCRVAYVDVDRVAVEHSKAILADNPRACAVHADLRDPDTVLADPTVRQVIDFSEPVAVLLVAVMHFVPDNDGPGRIIARYRDAMAPGSYLVICHASPGKQPDRAADHRALYNRTGTPMTMRSAEQIAALLDGFELVDPGLVLMSTWRPDTGEPAPADPATFPGYAGVARKP